MEKDEGIGLGDLVDKITEVTGIKKLMPDCAECSRRRQEWNKIRLKNLRIKNGK